MDNAQSPFSIPDTQTCMSLNDRATRRQGAWQRHSSYLQAAALISTNQSQRGCLVSEFKLTFSHFKQYYTLFHALFHSHVFQKTSNNNSQLFYQNPPKVSNFGSAKNIIGLIKVENYFLFLRC